MMLLHVLLFLLLVPVSARADDCSGANPGAPDTFAFQAQTQTLCKKTLDATNTVTGATFNTPVLFGNVPGTYTHAGTPIITSPTISPPVLSGTTTGTYTLATPSNSGTNGGPPPILPTGATPARALASRFTEIVDVKDYGALGDNLTDDTTAAQAAVTAAFHSGASLYWPTGTYVTTASILHFHGVRHLGPGIVRRGNNLFFVEPKSGQTNVLYVSPSGVDTQDGLSSSQPFLTIQATGNTIYKYPYGDVTWKIQLASGTFTENTFFSKPFPTPNRVQFLGTPVADGVTPTTIMTSPGGASKVGLYFQNYMRVYVEDIKFTNYKDSGAVCHCGYSAGIIADEFSDLYTRNVFASKNDVGILAASNSRLRVQAGVVTSGGIGIKAISNTTYTIGYGGSAADITGATGPAILNNISGVLIQEGSYGHLDYGYVDSNEYGMEINVQSRSNTTFTIFANNSTPVVATLNSTYNDNIIGGSNTYTSNKNSVSMTSGSRRSGAVEEIRTFGPAVSEIDTASYATQSASPVTFFAKTFAANELGTRGANFKLKIHGQVVGVANTKTIVVTLGATPLLTWVIAASTASYYIEVECYNRMSSNSQKCLARGFENGVAPVINVVSIAENLTVAKSLTVTHQVTNVTDLNRITLSDLEIVH